MTLSDLEKICPAMWRETAPNTWVTDVGTLGVMLYYSLETKLYVLQVWSWDDLTDIKKNFLNDLRGLDKRVVDLCTQFPQRLGADCPDWIKSDLIDRLEFKIKYSSFWDGKVFKSALDRIKEKS